jgi:hypothetical protein
MSVTFIINYFLVGGNVSVNKTFLVTDFMNLKIKSAQSFRYVYRDRVCVLRVSARMYISICIYIVFLKKYQW